jgi:hypothetical protein
LCFVHGFNVSMEKITNDTYQGQCTLIEEEATQIKYHLNIAYNETWYTTNMSFMPLELDTKKNASQDPHDQVSIPGFETSVSIVSIAFILIFNLWIRKSNKKS